MEFKIIRNDISNLEADAVVLPANPKLREGSGTSKAIFDRAGSKELKAACKELLRCHGDIRVGFVVPTLGYGLAAKFILHAVVPKWKDGKHDEYRNLCSAYISSLELADTLDCKSVAFPLLASGNNKFDKELAMQIAVECIREYQPKHSLTEAILVIYGSEITHLFKDHGYEVTEIIDASYEIGKDERIKLPHEHVVNEAKKLADLYVIDSLKKALEFIEDPKTVEAVQKEAGKALLGAVDMVPGIVIDKITQQIMREDKDETL